jgi:hypothetical protein
MIAKKINSELYMFSEQNIMSEVIVTIVGCLKRGKEMNR